MVSRAYTVSYLITQTGWTSLLAISFLSGPVGLDLPVTSEGCVVPTSEASGTTVITPKSVLQTMSLHLRATLVIALLVLVLGGVGTVSADPDVGVNNVTVTPDDPTTGDTITGTIEIENFESTDEPVSVSSVYVRTRGSARTHFRVGDAGSIPPGGSVSVPLSFELSNPGEHYLEINVVVRSSGGQESFTYPLLLTVEEPRIDVDVQPSIDDGNATEPLVTEVSNFGNTAATDVEVRVQQADTVVARSLVGDVDPGSSDVVRFGADTLLDGPATITVRYEALDAERTENREFRIDRSQFDDVDGEIRLTRVRTTGGSTVTLEGDAANVGGTDVDSVLVSVAQADGVRPVEPSREYFVGGVDTSEFATFELTAAVDGDVTAVPVRIEYVVDGERRTDRVDLDVDASAPATPAGAVDGDAPVDEPGDDGRIGLLGWGVLLIGLVVVAGIVYVRRIRE